MLFKLQDFNVGRALHAFHSRPSFHKQEITYSEAVPRTIEAVNRYNTCLFSAFKGEHGTDASPDSFQRYNIPAGIYLFVGIIKLLLC